MIMADETNDKSISSTVTGFPDYLSFEKLRSDAIAYLGNLTGKIWTDYNVHDPGITILETLIYAVLDLGYRTNLPTVDLLTKNPKDTAGENNFFTPSQILTNNPLTIMDFRKLLIDIRGVKNAWLTVEDQLPAHPCEKMDSSDKGNNPQQNPCQHDFLNGLYHVYIETERNDLDLTKPEDKDEYNAIVYKVKCALMRHRNLCEDFIDLNVLCTLRIGLCADIELEPEADAGDVYLKMLEALQSFLSPSPKFYTLPQLLEKGKSLEEIFAGRPYNLSESHGFVDTDEFEGITLRKKLHLSDVYHVLFDVDGVKNVRNLEWRKCDGVAASREMINQWVLQLPENHVPKLDPGCSRFQFFKYGLEIKSDTSEADSVFALKFSENGKILYKQSSPYLDTIVPKGVYRDDLAGYYSIQNEFPHVYGIKKGDLSASVSDHRKAQALQLQGFLLFFDQLLANYLSQLRNIPSLFSFSAGDAETAHTYFANKLTDVPELQKLLRFNTGDNEGEPLAAEGSVIAFPTSRKNLEDLIGSGKIKNTDLDRRCNDQDNDDFPPFQFCYGAVRDQAELQLMDDLLNGDYEPVVISNYNECYFFYIFTSSTDFALISKKYYGSYQDAQVAAASVKYLGTFKDNYYSFLIGGSSARQFFSFNLQTNINAYTKYLQLIIEDENLYNTRRQGFLNHLLARFAEKFTDFALLNSGIKFSEVFPKSQIKAEERFLMNYPDLSSNRGKAYNYYCDGWNNDNVSGLEKRVKALSGMQEWRKHYLCNFVVEKADEIYRLSISLFGNSFAVSGKYFTYEAGYAALASVYSKLRDNPVFEYEPGPYGEGWDVFVRDEFGNKFISGNSFDTKEAAETYAGSLQSIAADKPQPESKVYVSKYIYKLQLRASKGELIEESKTKFDSTADAGKYFNKISGKISSYLNDPKEFQKEKKGFKLDKLAVVSADRGTTTYIDKNKFNFIFGEVIQLEKVRIKFTLLNDKKTIQFDSLLLFETQKDALSAFDELIRLLTDRDNYHSIKNIAGDAFEIRIKSGDDDVAVFFPSFATEEDAENKIPVIQGEIRSYTYQLAISDPVADNWEFTYDLRSPVDPDVEFKSQAGFTTEQQAQSAVKQFYSHIPELNFRKTKTDVQLLLDRKKKIAVLASLPPDTDGSSLNTTLQYHQTLVSEMANPSKKLIDSRLAAGKDPKLEKFIYKLVDKDNLLAKSPFVSEEPADALKFRNELIMTARSGYDYTRLVYGQEAINERTGTGSKKVWYHYLVRCHNLHYQKGTMKDQPFILFESVLGYETREDALNAFNENYLPILRKASDERNYGEGKYINIKELLVHNADDCQRILSTVFIRPETLYEFDGDAAKAIHQIASLVKAFPVKFIAEGIYRFALYNQKTGKYDWRSVPRFATPHAAMESFQFFYSLLNYAGNYFIEKNDSDCRFRIFIREVLAISTDTFPTEVEAWGNTGIENFICVAQSENGFHTYLNRANCRNSFYVACGNTGLIHPCKYETPERRDAVLEHLYKAAAFNFFDLLKEGKDNTFLLYGLDKKPVAKLFMHAGAGRSTKECERLIEIFEAMDVDANFSAKGSKEVALWGRRPGNDRLAEPFDKTILQEDWIQQMRSIRCYFPLFRKQRKDANPRNTRGSCDFYVQIQLPGFNNCKDDRADSFPVTNADDGCRPGCSVAWKSDCCFSTCSEAVSFYLSALKLLSVSENYRPTHDCSCGNYGIELHQLKLQKEDRADETSGKKLNIISARFHSVNDNRDGAGQPPTGCRSEIVAINPQQYDNSMIACQAVDRAKKLINCEGMHLVEHILLRPRCKEDCDCAYRPKHGIEDHAPAAKSRRNICHFQWEQRGEPDPCASGEPVFFTPGCDPYSFIVTVALPAWPERFRSKEHRAVFEKLLQKEAPAYILLRILWLNPHDLCCFEYHFRKWNLWLAKKMCDLDYTTCDFLGFLFQKRFVPLAECEQCIPCSCNDALPVSCFEKDKVPCQGFDLRTQLDELYCWNKEDYDIFSCDANVNEVPGIVLAKNIEVAKPEKAPEPSLAVLKKAASKTAEVERDESRQPDDRQRYLLMQSRFSKYHEIVQKAMSDAPGNKIVEDTLRFLSDSNPEAERYEALVNKIAKDKTNKAKGVTGLTVKEKNLLIENISWQFLDRICMTEKAVDKIRNLTSLFNHLRKTKINMQQLFDNWKGTDLLSVEPNLNLKEIKKAIT